MNKSQIKDFLIHKFGINIVSKIHGFLFVYYYLFKKDIIDPEIKIIRGFNIKSSIAIDVGANGAEWTLKLAELAKKVIAFEPHPYYFKATKFAVNLNPFSKIDLLPIALSSSQKTLKFAIKKDGKDLAYLSRLVEANEKLDNIETIEVKTQTLDNILKKNKDSISIIKVDVEGHEFEVIKGSIKTIENHLPIIIFEINTGPVGEQSFSNIYEILSKLNYYFFYVQSENKIIECNNYSELPNPFSRNLIGISSKNSNYKNFKKFKK